MSGLIAFLSFPLELVARSNGAGHRSRRFRPSKNWRGRLSRSRTTRSGSTSTRTAAPAASSWPRSTWTCSSRCQPSPRINSFKVHRLLITSVMVAAKFMDDMYYNNAYYAKVGGITTAEMNFLELDFLFGLGFHLNVTPATFGTYCTYLQREMLLLSSPPMPPSASPSSSTSPSSEVGRPMKMAAAPIRSRFIGEDEASHHKNQQQLAAV